MTTPPDARVYECGTDISIARMTDKIVMDRLIINEISLHVSST